MKLKITYLEDSPYGVIQGQWAFVKKIKGGYETLGNVSSCKDYTHDAICNVVHKKNINTFAGYKPAAKISFDKLQLVMFFDNVKNKKKYVYSTKRMLNSIERSCQIKTTKITEVSHGNKARHAFIITADKVYIESPALMHGLIAFFRTMHHYNESINIKNVAKVLNSKAIRDSNVLKFVISNNIMNLLMLNHADIFKGRTLKDIYPPRVTNKKGNGDLIISYHGGFGMIALRNRRLASKKYSDRVLKVLDNNKIQKM